LFIKGNVINTPRILKRIFIIAILIATFALNKLTIESNNSVKGLNSIVKIRTVNILKIMEK
jgi:hypothetical protein